MKQTLLALLAVGIFYSCTQRHQGEAITDKQVIDNADTVSVTLDVNQESNQMDCPERIWNNRPWQEFESSQNPDTALTIYAFRIICTGKIPDYTEPEIHINLHDDTQRVKSLMQTIFSNEKEIIMLNLKLDSINQDFIEYARKEVQAEIKQYGVSDGPLYEFVERLDKK